MKNVYNFSYEDYLNFHNEAEKRAELAEHKTKKAVLTETEDLDKIFESQKIALEYYGAILYYDFFNKIHKKFGYNIIRTRIDFYVKAYIVFRQYDEYGI